MSAAENAMSIPLGFVLAVVPFATPAEAADAPVAAAVESTLATARTNVRQLAFDGDPDTYFESEKDAGPTDRFTLVFDKPVAVKSITVTTGKPDGGNRLDAGVLEASEDGK